MNSRSSASRIGLIHALIACLIWGIMPIYFKLLQSVAPLEVVAHRVVWSVLVLLFILWLRKNLKALAEAWREPKVRGFLLLSSALVTVNWLIYVWAVQADHILGASLGYFISPLLSVFFGTIFLKEKLGRYQWGAIGIAALGVSVLAVEAWQTLWISLALAGSWSAYALVRKVAVVGPVVGLTFETSYIFPFFAGFLLWITFGQPPSADGTHFGDSMFIDLMLLGGAVMTAIPLLLFASAVKKMSLSAIGLLSYLAPTIQFLVGVFIYNEPLTTSHVICFLLIWTSLAIFSADSFFAERKRQQLAVTTPA